ncbi:MAG: hypothetical protein Q9207_004559 [Kuettlingeria erythrocarpa]
MPPILYVHLTKHSLSRPAFCERIKLPAQPIDVDLPINPDAVLDDDYHGVDSFLFSPLLQLPPAFGSAYVGENFSCTLCANNELPKETGRKVFSVNISVEMQAPTQTVPLESVPEDEKSQRSLDPGESLQKIFRFDLKEKGTHVLAVSVQYTETASDHEETTATKPRTFRKLYQFVAAPCLSVRTKVSEFPLHEVQSDKRPYTKPLSFALEAQLENMADGPITLEKITFSSKPSFAATSFNWDTSWPGMDNMSCPFLLPRDVTQAAFLIRQKPVSKVEMTKDGRAVLGQLMIQWRTQMGDPGFLTTGWLITRKRS